MRILIDLQGCQNGSRHRGIGRYSLSLTKALLRNAGEHEIFILLNGLFEDTLEPLQTALAEHIDPSRILVFSAVGPVDELQPANAWRKHAAELLRESMIADLAPDALLVSSMVEGSMDNSVTSVGWVGGPTVVAAVLYDLIPLLDPDKYIGWAPARQWYDGKMESFLRCDLLLAISASAKREAEMALGVAAERVHNISTAADAVFVDIDVPQSRIEACRQRLGITRPYLMHSGNVEERKNFKGLISAYGSLDHALRSRHQLVLVGKFSTEARLELEAAADHAGLQPHELVLTGHIDDDVLVALYAGCHLFVFPSLHEGFGLPALEAMHFGVPTIGSNTTSIPEVIGRADATFDPTSTAAIAHAITRCLTDTDYYGELQQHARVQARKFSWDACARAAISALETAVSARRAEGLAPSNAAARSDLVLNQMVAGPGMSPPGAEDLLNLARCMALNEARVERSLAHARNGKQLTWRVEGPFDSSYSLALVNREVARALRGFGHEVALHSTEGPGDFDADPAFLAANPDLADMHASAPLLPHGACDVVSRNLYPPRVSGMGGGLNILHPYAWEETGFPAQWIASFNDHLQGITCLSTHVQKVLLDNGIQVPMAAVGAGTDHWLRVEATPGLRFPGKRFRFLHVSSCFPRKGADVMLAAFGDAYTSADDVSLLIKTFPNPHNTIREQIAACRQANPAYPDVHVLEDDLADADLKALYQHCHVLVAPSRAEGFGLPMAEAMLSGVPVITTNWGGQLDFCAESNAWLVDYTFSPTQTHMGLHGSVWADPDRASLREAMQRARASSPAERAARAANGRALLLEHYTWAAVTARSLAAVRQWTDPPPRPRDVARVGWITTWNTKCGIASYSRHIIDAAAREVTVFAPQQDGRLQSDERHCLRCWMADKHENRLQDLSAAVDQAGVDVLILQFNYSFFNFAALAAFLERQVDAGRVVMVTMHSTGDPPHLAAGDANWQLSTLAPALARCHRVVAHTIADLNRLKRLGLTANVMLFPHPLWRLPPTQAPEPQRNDLPLLATFGYCLPHKGLAEVIDSVAMLRDRGTPVRLQMLNAEYPDPVSAALVRQLRARIADLRLQPFVDLHTTYLDDGDASARLAQSALIVFAYQDTQESASGAIRHGMATERPVLVTPVPIFDELGAAVFRADGTGAESIAQALSLALRQLAEASPQATAVADSAAAWRAAHDVRHLASRLHATAEGLHLARPAPPACHLDGSSRMLRTQVGHVVGRTIRSTGRQGILLFGPYLPLGAGAYVVELRWSAVVPRGATATLRVVVDTATRLLAMQPLASGKDARVSVAFQLDKACSDLEVHLTIDAVVEAEVRSVVVRAADRQAMPTPASAECGATA